MTKSQILEKAKISFSFSENEVTVNGVTQEKGVLFNIRIQFSKGENIIADLIKIAKRASCYGGMGGVPVSELELDEIGRYCQWRKSQKPGSSEFFLDPIVAIYVEY